MAARSGMGKPDGSGPDKGGWLGPALAGSAAVLGAVALGSYAKAVAAERRHPPGGRFMTMDGVRLHYLERGSGPPVVLFHGNGPSSKTCWSAASSDGSHAATG
jgi:hypothetical protein